MAGFYNRVILMGNLTRDPELKYLPNNVAVCEFGLAVNRKFRDRDGNQREEVCFVDISAFARAAETINQYMSKGQSILIEGRLKLDTWQGQDGSKRSKHTVVVDTFQFVGGRGDGGGGQRRQVDQDASVDGGAFGGGSGGGLDDAPPASGDNIPF